MERKTLYHIFKSATRLCFGRDSSLDFTPLSEVIGSR
jgi:hypothetical protein